MNPESKSSGLQQVPDFTDPVAMWQSTFERMGGWAKPDMGAFETLQGAAQTWMTHRLEDFQKAVETSRKMAECKDLAEAAAIQQKWLAESTQRLVADWTALMTPTAWQSIRGTPRKAAE
jgi:hypothetical protein